MQTTVVGNYPKIPNRPRPARLRVALNKRDRGEITDEELARVRDEVTVEVIQEQIDAGVDIVTDGQVRWDDDQTYIATTLKGIEIGSLQRYMDTNTYYRQPEITGPVSWQAPALVSDFQFARENSSKAGEGDYYRAVHPRRAVGGQALRQPREAGDGAGRGAAQRGTGARRRRGASTSR